MVKVVHQRPWKFKHVLRRGRVFCNGGRVYEGEEGGEGKEVIVRWGWRRGTVISKGALDYSVKKKSMVSPFVVSLLLAVSSMYYGLSFVLVSLRSIIESNRGTISSKINVAYLYHKKQISAAWALEVHTRSSLFTTT